MHACLDVAEIVLNIAEKANEIFEDMVSETLADSEAESVSDSDSSLGLDNEDSKYWREEEEKRLKRDPVLSLALCCKSFHRQAICVLWKTLYSLFPLFECFPDDVWCPAESADARASSDHSRSGFLRQPTDSEWQRFLMHSSKLRSLTIDCHGSDYCLGDLHYLNDHWPTLQLFPGLRRLNWENCSDEDTLASPMFISPTLTMATATMTKTEGAKFLLNTLADRAPALRGLRIASSRDVPVAGLALENVVSKFTHLVQFACDCNLSPATLKHLSTLPYLSEVECNISSRIDPEDPAWRKSGAPFFPALKILRLAVWRITPAALELLERLMLVPLRTFAISFGRQPQATLLQSLLQVISKCSTLTAVKVELSVVAKTSQNYLLDESNLRPLYKLPLLVLLMPTLPFSLDDESLEAIGTALPSLTILKIGNMCEIGSTSVTYRGLLDIATRCPGLREFGAHVDLDGARLGELFLYPPKPRCNLRHVEIAPIPIENTLAAAAVMSAAFPHAVFACASRPKPSPEVAISVDELNCMKTMFVVVRCQERAGFQRASIVTGPSDY